MFKYVLYWEELVLLFNEEFTTPGELSISDFSEIKFKMGENLSEIKKKMHSGQVLGLDTKLLLKGLIDLNS